MGVALGGELAGEAWGCHPRVVTSPSLIDLRASALTLAEGGAVPWLVAEEVTRGLQWQGQGAVWLPDVEAGVLFLGAAQELLRRPPPSRGPRVLLVRAPRELLGHGKLAVALRELGAYLRQEHRTRLRLSAAAHPRGESQQAPWWSFVGPGELARDPTQITPTVCPGGQWVVVAQEARLSPTLLRQVALHEGHTLREVTRYTDVAGGLVSLRLQALPRPQALVVRLRVALAPHLPATVTDGLAEDLL